MSPKKIQAQHSADLQQRIRDLECRCNELESALVKANSSLVTYFDYALIGIIETDLSFNILRCNQAASSMFGKNRKQLETENLAQLFSVIDHVRSERHFSLLKEQGITFSELACRDSEHLSRLTLNSIQSEEQHYVHFIDDVTEQHLAKSATEKALLAAEASDRAKSAFLANISHEIRTPLNGIIGLSRLAQSSSPQEQQKYLVQIGDSGRILLNIVNDLLDYAKIESGSMSYENIDFALDDVFDDLVAYLGYGQQEPEVDLAFIPEAHVPEFLSGDRMRVTQCLSNLLSNALKFTKSGSVRLKIQLDSATGPQWLKFIVIDTGIGIAPEAIPTLFDPFTQADVSTVRRYGGTGLGLALVKQLVEGMGGQLSVDSEPGVGTCFTMQLPLVASKASLFRNELRQGHAMVITDRPVIEEAISAILHRKGWQVSSRLEAALATLDAESSDLLVLDASVAVLDRLKYCTDNLPPTLLIDNQVSSLMQRLQTLPLRWQMISVPVLPSILEKAILALNEDTAPISFIESYTPPPGFSGVHLLVAEDNPVNQQLILNLLEQAGIYVTLAQNGFEVLEKIRTLATQPAAILMDIQMPAMDGLETTRRLRADGYDLPIIAMSAGVSKIEQGLCDDAGLNDFLEKPIDFDQFWGVMTRWVKCKEPSSGPGATQTENMSHVIGLSSVASLFIRHHANSGQRMAELLANDDIEGVQRIIHQIKGVALSVGAVAIADLCPQLKAAADMKDLQQLSLLIKKFSKEFDIFANAAQSP